jgi:hypothetical protein
MEEKKVIYADELVKLMKEYDMSSPIIDDHWNYYGSQAKSIGEIWIDFIGMIEQSSHTL